MRKRTVIVLPALAVILGFAGMALYQHNKRSPASVINWAPPSYGKHLAPLKVAILEPKDVPESGDKEVTLIGRIAVNSAIDSDLSYAWTLPSGVSVVEGELSDDLADVQPGQIVEVKLVVMGFSKESQRHVSLQASIIKGRIEMGASAVISSRPEDSWEAIAPEMQKAAEENLGVEKFRRGPRK